MSSICKWKVKCEEFLSSIECFRDVTGEERKQGVTSGSQI